MWLPAGRQLLPRPPFSLCTYRQAGSLASCNYIDGQQTLGDGLNLSYELHMCWLSNPGRPCLCIFPSSHISPQSNLPQHSSSAATASLLKHHQHYLQNPKLPTHQTLMQQQTGLRDVFANQLKLFLLLVCFVREGDKNKWNYFCYKEEDKSFILNLKPLCKTPNRFTWISLVKR